MVLLRILGGKQTLFFFHLRQRGFSSEQLPPHRTSPQHRSHAPLSYTDVNETFDGAEPDRCTTGGGGGASGDVGK